MVPLLAAALISVPAASAPVAASVQAKATIRIVRAVRIEFDGPADVDMPRQRTTEIAVDGTKQPAKLIEFQ
jgi:hypothetical protein